MNTTKHSDTMLEISKCIAQGIRVTIDIGETQTIISKTKLTATSVQDIVVTDLKTQRDTNKDNNNSNETYNFNITNEIEIFKHLKDSLDLSSHDTLSKKYIENAGTMGVSNGLYHIPIEYIGKGLLKVLVINKLVRVRLVVYPLAWFIQNVNYRGITLSGESLDTLAEQIKVFKTLGHESIDLYEDIADSTSIFGDKLELKVSTNSLTVDNHGNLLELRNENTSENKLILNLQGVKTVSRTTHLFKNTTQETLLVNTHELSTESLQAILSSCCYFSNFILSLIDYTNKAPEILHKELIAVREHNLLVAKNQLDTQVGLCALKYRLNQNGRSSLLVIEDERKTTDPIQLAKTCGVRYIQAYRDIDNNKLRIETGINNSLFGINTPNPKTYEIDYKGQQCINLYMEHIKEYCKENT